MIQVAKQNNKNQKCEKVIKYYTRTEVEQILSVAFNSVSTTEIMKEKSIEIAPVLDCDNSIYVIISADNKETRIKIL